MLTRNSHINFAEIILCSILCDYKYDLFPGKRHQGLSSVDERTLTKRLFGGSVRNGEDSGDQPSASSSSRDNPRKPSTQLSSNSTKNLGVGSSTVDCCTVTTPCNSKVKRISVAVL